MKHLIFTIFVLVPLIEIAIFIEFSEAFGIWTTITLILVSALIGGKLFQSQGLHTLQKALASTENLFPAQEVFDGACIFLASLLLITPGIPHRSSRASTIFTLLSSLSGIKNFAVFKRPLRFPGLRRRQKKYKRQGPIRSNNRN